MTHKKKHHHHKDLTGEYFAGDAGQIILALLFTAIWIADSFFLEYSTFLNQYIPLAVRIPIGLVFLIISAYLSIKGHLIVFGKNRENTGVIRENVFNIVRHPIYLSEILLYFGLLILNISIAAAIVWIIGVAFLHYISRYEESLLLARFGKEYEQYIKEVPMWIPRLRK
ncbi:MAG: isoprenylcysteine carboxylmethyltransferase family protein [Bacteroidales bacterium]|nr:isoprenylcysteine carboxylmethyltransferase family protein [Bacteroidales bacterium]